MQGCYNFDIRRVEFQNPHAVPLRLFALPLTIRAEYLRVYSAWIWKTRVALLPMCALINRTCRDCSNLSFRHTTSKLCMRLQHKNNEPGDDV